MFHAVDAKTGAKRWTFETNNEITGGANFAGPNVLVGYHDPTLYCLLPGMEMPFADFERWNKGEGRLSLGR